MRKYVGMVVLDLQKAFDTVNQKIIINKLKALGLNQIAINWFVSYLRDREQMALSTELKAVNEWLEENRLSLYIGKTQSILFESKRVYKKMISYISHAMVRTLK